MLAGSATALRSMARRVATSVAAPPPELTARASAIDNVGARDRARAVGRHLERRPRTRGAGTGTRSATGARTAANVRVVRLPRRVLSYRRALRRTCCSVSGTSRDRRSTSCLPARALRIAARPGTIVVFDPFEVHGVLRPGATEYHADDYADCATSVFVGFELELDDTVRAAFDLASARCRRAPGVQQHAGNADDRRLRVAALARAACAGR